MRLLSLLADVVLPPREADALVRASEYEDVAKMLSPVVRGEGAGAALSLFLYTHPLVEACITAKEWRRIGKAAQRGTPLKDGPRMLGMLAYDGDPDVVRQMLGAVPGPMRGAMVAMGRRAYAKHAWRVYRTPTP